MTAIVSVVPWSLANAGEVEVAAVVAMVRTAMAQKRPSEQRSAHRTRQLLEQWFETGRTGAIVARGRGNELHGICVIRNDPPSIRIVFLCVKYLHQGCGTAMARKVEELARRHRLSEVRATINPEDDVQTGFFIDHLGYVLSPRATELVEGVAHYDAMLVVAGGSDTASGMGIDMVLGTRSLAEDSSGGLVRKPDGSADATDPGTSASAAKSGPRIRISVKDLELGDGDGASPAGPKGPPSLNTTTASFDGPVPSPPTSGRGRVAPPAPQHETDALAADLEAAAERRARLSGRGVPAPPPPPAAPAPPPAAPAPAMGAPAPALPPAAATVAPPTGARAATAAARPAAAPPEPDADDSADEEDAEDDSDPGEATMRPFADKPAAVLTASPGVDAEEPTSRRQLSRGTARAVVISGDTKRRVSLATKDSFLIGRAPEADIVLVGKKASRRHCELRWVADKLVVEDLGSSNGTFLNGRPVARGELYEGDVVSVGRTRIGFDNLGSRSQPVEIAGRLPTGEHDPGDTHATTIRRMRGPFERDLQAARGGGLTEPGLPPLGSPQVAIGPSAPPAAPPAAPPSGLTDSGQLLELRRVAEEAGLRAAALDGIAEAARTTAQHAQQELGAERALRQRLERDLADERARREQVERAYAAEQARWSALERAVTDALGAATAAGATPSALAERVRDLAARREALAEAMAEVEQAAADVAETVAAWSALERVLVGASGAADAAGSAQSGASGAGAAGLAAL